MILHFPRPRILDAISLDRHAVIEASAGTGKTYTIETIFIELILRARLSITEILALTFTERAAAELRERIRSKIESILVFAEDQTVGIGERPRDGWLIDEAAHRNLSRALSAFDGASIGTIHGFFGRVLTEHAFTNGRLFAGSLEDGRSLFGRAFKTALRRSLARRPGDAADLITLWLEKGRGGIEKLESLLWACHSSRRQILPPFSLKVLERQMEQSPLFLIDLREEAEQFKLALKRAKIHANTVNAMMLRMALVADRISESGRHRDFVFEDDFQDAISVIAKGLKNRELVDAKAKQIAEAFVQLDQSLVSLDAAIAQTSLPIVKQFLDRHKATSGEYDHDDQINGVVDALTGTHGDELVRAMRARYRFALIDEFQDTDELQWAFFKRVFVESEGRNPIFLIGDPKQAIYGFRGADIDTYLQARDQVKQAGSPVLPLVENFRSTQALIDAYNHILDSTASPAFFDGEIRYDRPVIAGRKMVAEEANGKTAAPIHLLKVEPRDGETLSTGELRRGLAKQIASEIGTLLLDKTGLLFGPEGELRKIQPGDIYVLTATNKEALYVSRALRDAQIPFAFYKQEGLFQTDEARAIHDLLAAIADPSDIDKRGLAWITPFFDVPLGALPALAELSDTDPHIKRFKDWKELASRRQFETMFTRILDETGIIRRELLLKDDERALTNYLHIFEILLEEARRVGCALDDLVAILTSYIEQTRKPPGEESNIQRLESDRAAIQIMTIHKSKGLEAAVVFLYGGFGRFRAGGFYEYHDEGQRVLFIGDNDDARKKATEERCWEEQRLYYVALTRAKARLYLPLVPAKLGGKKWEGPYAHLNERLTAVVSNIENSVYAKLFQTKCFQDCPAITVRNDWTPQGARLATWSPTAALLEAHDPGRECAQYRRIHAGYVVSSYSKMKRRWNAELDPLERDEFRREPGTQLLATATEDDDLPGGTAVGTMLHEVLEKIPFDTLDSKTGMEDWLELTPVKDVFNAAMARNGITATSSQRGRAAEMVYRALTMELRFDALRSIPALHKCKNIITEMEFLFPFPETTSPGLSEPWRGKPIIEKGFIKGFVDLVVEHDGRVYFADWKSDVLPSYQTEALARHVSAHYDIQVKLYSLALVKALQIESESDYERLIGGLFYVFLRALRRTDNTTQGVCFQRLTWSEILRYEAELRRFDPQYEGAMG